MVPSNVKLPIKVDGKTRSSDGMAWSSSMGRAKSVDTASVAGVFAGVFTGGMTGGITGGTAGGIAGGVLIRMAV
jgi:hypothetical protein